MASARRTRLAVLIGLCIVAGAGATWYQTEAEFRARENSANYKVVWEAPKGWTKLEHGPQTLFLFRHPESGVLLRGAVNQIVAEVNPTPELDTEGIADYYIERTRENMPDWKAEKLDRVEGPGAQYRLIQRTRNNKSVVTAYSVRGNTTFLVSLSGNGKEAKELEAHMPEFREYLASISLRRTDLSALR